MKQVFSLLSQRRSELEEHAFFRLLRSDALPLEERFSFAPVLLDFIMGFADANKWFLSYPEPGSPLEHGINEHTEEDRGHSRLFMDNWQKLDLDRELGWPAGKTLWWLYQSEETAVVRQFGMEILKLSVRFPDVLARFALMEAIEVCGAVFFSHTAPVATALSLRSGVEYLYFGPYHLARETGHLHTNEQLFLEHTVSGEQRRVLERLVHTVFDHFLGVLDRLQAHTERLLAGRQALEREIAESYRAALAPPPERRAPSAALVPAEISSSQRPILAVLNERKARLAALGFFEWLAREEQLTPLEKLRRFVALWGVDIAGYKDFCDLVLTYPEPSSAEERAINRWARSLASHGSLYLQDWQALGLDEVLRWTAGETIAFYFLSDATELHRRNLARVTRHAVSHSRPVLRYWLITAFEAGGDALFEHTAPLARAIERERGTVLNYWANRHYLAHALEDAPAEEVDFMRLDVSDDERQIAIRIIHDLFDGFEAQFEASYRLARAGTFVAASRTLPPTQSGSWVAFAPRAAV